MNESPSELPSFLLRGICNEWLIEQHTETGDQGIKTKQTNAGKMNFFTLETQAVDYSLQLKVLKLCLTFFTFISLSWSVCPSDLWIWFCMHWTLVFCSLLTLSVSLSHSSVLFRSRETNEHSCLLSLLSGDWMLVVSPLLVIEEQMRAVWSSFAVCSTFLPCIIMIILCRANQTMSQRTNSHNEEEAEKRSAWCPSFPSLISWILPPVSLPSLSFSLLCIHHVLFPSPLLLLRNRFDADAPLD